MIPRSHSGVRDRMMSLLKGGIIAFRRIGVSARLITWTLKQLNLSGA